jgi:hypothetical protein
MFDSQTQSEVLPMSNVRPTRTVIDAIKAIDETVGGVLSWVAGKRSIRGADSAVAGATEELLSWTGLTTSGKKRRDSPGRTKRR